MHLFHIPQCSVLNGALWDMKYVHDSGICESSQSWRNTSCNCHICSAYAWGDIWVICISHKMAEILQMTCASWKKNAVLNYDFNSIEICLYRPVYLSIKLALIWVMAWHQTGGELYLDIELSKSKRTSNQNRTLRAIVKHLYIFGITITAVKLLSVTVLDCLL